MTPPTYKQKLATWEKAKFAPPPRPPLSPITPTKTTHIIMREGIRLYTELFLPESPKPHPTILTRSPYPFSRASRNGRIAIERLLQAGYAVVFQLTRGQGSSEGEFQLLKNEGNDGYDTIQWIAEQPWCDGKVGMRGASYLGSTQIQAARAKPPALKCIAPTAFVGNSVTCLPFSYGVPCKGSYMQWQTLLDAEDWADLEVDYGDVLGALNHPKWGPAFRKRPLVDAADEVLSGNKLQVWKDTISQPTENEFWQDVHFTDQDLAELDLPIFFTDGWYDATIGPIDFFARMENNQVNHSDRYLLVGPWDHYQTGAPSKPGDDNGDRVLPDNGAIDHLDHLIAFYDRYLKDDKKAEIQSDRVRAYITGANRWLNLSTFPAPDTEFQPLYLHSAGDARGFPGDGELSFRAPDDEPSDRYTYDPDLPTPSLMETFTDRRDTEVRSDVLTYTSEPFTEPLTILGEITLVLHAASSARDTDWFALITDVSPDGQSRSFHYAPPAFRARYREGMDKEVYLTPNKPEVFRIPMGPAGHQIGEGHRLRLSIFSAAFPEYDPNSNTGAPAATDMGKVVAEQTIYHDSLRPSHLILPVLKTFI